MNATNNRLWIISNNPAAEDFTVILSGPGIHLVSTRPDSKHAMLNVAVQYARRQPDPGQAIIDVYNLYNQLTGQPAERNALS